MFTGTLEIAKLNVIRETEKAFGIKAWCNYNRSSKTWEITVWVPKSIIKNGEIPEWFYAKKSQEFALEDKHVVLEMA